MHVVVDVYSGDDFLFVTWHTAHNVKVTAFKFCGQMLKRGWGKQRVAG